jgi:hypothetical protein
MDIEEFKTLFRNVLTEGEDHQLIAKVIPEAVERLIKEDIDPIIISNELISAAIMFTVAQHDDDQFLYIADFLQEEGRILEDLLNEQLAVGSSLEWFNSNP